MDSVKPTYHLDDPSTDIYVGDNREVLSQFPAESVDLIFADPPFNWDFDYGKWMDKMPREEYLRFTYEWLDACVRVLAQHGSLWINIPDDTAAEIVMYLKGKLKLYMINWCIWHFRFGQCRNKNFIVSKVHILYFAKDPKKRIWNPDHILEPSDRATTYGDRRTRETETPGLRVPFDVWYGPFWGRVQGNNKERQSLHVNQIPEVYMDRIIRACSKKGNLVLDPFLGSGTTCTVARALGRRSIGIEYNRELAKSAFGRIKKGPVRNNYFETAVERAFYTVHEGESSEEVVINDRLRKAFLKSCDEQLKKLGQKPRSEFDYNWKLWNFRKEGKLGRGLGRKRKKEPSIKSCDDALARKVAKQIQAEGLLKSKTIDRIMCDPDLRKEFDRKAKNIDPRIDIYLVRKAALNERKNPHKG
ncbi:MAG: DNA methyltransferase [Sedimentisphaerales bacterium]|jgi:DNA modification methylase